MRVAWWWCAVALTTIVEAFKSELHSMPAQPSMRVVDGGYQLQASQTINIAAGQVYQVGPSSGSGPATLGYAITSATTFDVVLVNLANLNLLKNSQSFQYYAAYSGRQLSSATLPEQSFQQPEALYLVIGTMSYSSLLATTVQANIAFLSGTCSLTLCQNGGLCTGGNVCSCAVGWSGATCTTPVCSTGCSTNAYCSAPDTCTCSAGWTGAPACTTPVCSSACLNGGACTAPNTCACRPPYSGTHCTSSTAGPSSISVYVEESILFVAGRNPQTCASGNAYQAGILNDGQSWEPPGVQTVFTYHALTNSINTTCLYGTCDIDTVSLPLTDTPVVIWKHVVIAGCVQLSIKAGPAISSPVLSNIVISCLACGGAVVVLIGFVMWRRTHAEKPPVLVVLRQLDTPRPQPGAHDSTPARSLRPLPTTELSSVLPDFRKAPRKTGVDESSTRPVVAADAPGVIHSQV